MDIDILKGRTSGPLSWIYRGNVSISGRLETTDEAPPIRHSLLSRYAEVPPLLWRERFRLTAQVPMFMDDEEETAPAIKGSSEVKIELGLRLNNLAASIPLTRLYPVNSRASFRRTPFHARLQRTSSLWCNPRWFARSWPT